MNLWPTVVMVDEGGDGGGGTEEWCDGRGGEAPLVPYQQTCEL